MSAKKLDQSVFDGLPSEYRWAAVDANGEAHLYNRAPELSVANDFFGYFTNFAKGDDYLDLGDGYDASDWQNSLIERQDVPTADKPESITDVARSIEAARVAEKSMPFPDGDARYFETSDVVNNPAHYTTGGIECIDAMQAMLSHDEFIGYLRGNIFKYQWRYKHKNGVEDLRKADWYARRLIEIEGAK